MVLVNLSINKHIHSYNMNKNIKLLSDTKGYANFGVPLWQRVISKVKEDIKTTKQVAGDILSKKAWKDPSTNSRYDNFALGIVEAKNRGKAAINQKSMSNKAKQVAMNKQILQDKSVKDLRKQFSNAGYRSPTNLEEYDGMVPESLADKRVKLGKKRSDVSLGDMVKIKYSKN